MKNSLFVILIMGFIGCSDDAGVVMPTMPDPIPDPEPLEQLDIAAVDVKVADFMTKYDIPGAAIAVSVGEKMVYTKGYGKANKETGEDVSVDNVFRLGSISKLFTSIGIHRLVDEGKLELSDKVFGPGSILGDRFGSARPSTDVKKITVDHLLYNTAGGWGAALGGEALDTRPETNNDEFLEYLIKDRPLSVAPGEQYAYSNTGYWLLARVIEKVSKKTYKAYLSEILAPAGVTTFHTTDFEKSGRLENEVEYYGQGVDAQYVDSFSPKRDGDGGVVLSAPDLLRSICAIDGFGERPDVLSAQSILSMKATKSTAPNWGRGIGVWPEQSILYMTGSIAGTRTWLIRGDNGVTALLLANSRSPIASFDNDLQIVVLDMVRDGNLPWIRELDQF